MKAYDHSGNNPSASLSDKDLLDDGIRGAQELCFNNQSNSLTEAYVTLICNVVISS